jgi:hypothetical protein
MIQPMTPYSPQTDLTLAPPFWAEVAAPVAPIRQWGAADAPLVTRIGHGGVLRIIDRLPGNREGTTWYGVASENGLLFGWTQAIFWRPVDTRTSTAVQPILLIDQNSQHLTAYDGEEIVLRAPMSTGEIMIPSSYPVSGRYPTGILENVPEYPQGLHGVPWTIRLGEDYQLSGAYWHNRFGSTVSGPAIQVPPVLAHWLYDWLGDNGIVSIV